MNIRLSFCIPTHNFGAFIGATLESIISQATENVEIVVVDGASTDNTTDVVRHYQEMFPRLNYRRLDKKGGIDRDMAATVELARGDYCWLLSSDDVLKPGAIQRILNELQSGHKIYLCNRTECDKDLLPLMDQPWLSGEINDCAFHLATKEELLEYFDKSRSIGALFSYMSSIVVHRATWHEIPYDETFTGSNYAHVFRLFSMLQKGGTLKYIKEPLVLCRGDNDSFMEHGQFRRAMVDFNGYHHLAARLFPDPEVRRAFLSVMTRNIAWHHLISLKDTAPDSFRWKGFESKLLDYGDPPRQLRLASILASRPVFPIARYFWRLIHPPKRK